MIATLLSFVLSKGVYYPVNPSHPDVCPQKITSIYGQNSEIYELSVVYVGDCFYWGPFKYSCESDYYCGDDDIGFQIIGNDRYIWFNNVYGIQSQMTLSM